MLKSRSLLGWIGFLVASIALAWSIDTRVYHWTVDFAVRTESIRPNPIFRAAGRFSTWVLVAVVLALLDHRRRATRSRSAWAGRARLLILPGVLAGLASVLLKLVVRRERPLLHDGAIWFRPFSEKLLSSSGMGMPSGETSVAFASAFMLYRMYPSAWPVWFLLGYGCGFSRMLVGMHFLSDIVAGAFLGCACASVVWKYCRTDEQRLLPARPPRTGSWLRGAAWLGLLLCTLFCASRWSAWKPASESDLLGIYSSRQLSGPALTYFFTPDGRYTSCALHEASPPRLEHSSGTWRFGDGKLWIDDADPVLLETSSRLLRLGGATESVVLYREERWDPASWAAESR